MIAGMPIVATIKPFSTPINVAIAMETIIASHMFQPIFIIRCAQTTFTSTTIDAIERSIPAIRITNVIPIDAMP